MRLAVGFGKKGGENPKLEIIDTLTRTKRPIILRPKKEQPPLIPEVLLSRNNQLYIGTESSIVVIGISELDKYTRIILPEEHQLKSFPSDAFNPKTRSVLTSVGKNIIYGRLCSWFETDLEQRVAFDGFYRVPLELSNGAPVTHWKPHKQLMPRTTFVTIDDAVAYAAPHGLIKTNYPLQPKGTRRSILRSQATLQSPTTMTYSWDTCFVVDYNSQTDADELVIFSKDLEERTRTSNLGVGDRKITAMYPFESTEDNNGHYLALGTATGYICIYRVTPQMNIEQIIGGYIVDDKSQDVRGAAINEIKADHAQPGDQASALWFATEHALYKVEIDAMMKLAARTHDLRAHFKPEYYDKIKEGVAVYRWEQPINCFTLIL